MKNNRAVFFFAALVVALALTAGAEATLRNNLSAYYTFDSGFTDSLGRFNGTSSGSPTAINGSKCILNGCYDFDPATTDVIRVPGAPFSNLTAGTINLWVYADTNPASAYYFGNRNTGVIVRAALSLETSTYRTTLNGTDQTTLNAHAAGQRTMYTLWWNGTNRILYRNGTAIQNITSTLGTPNVPTEMGIGSGWDGSANWDSMDGSVDELGVWSRALTQSEINSLFANGNGLSFSNFTSGATTNLSITATNAYTNASVLVFNASVTWNGTTLNYTTTNGTIQTNATVNSTLPANITITAQNFFSFTSTNNPNTTLAASITPWANITASDRYDTATINNFTVDYNGTNYTTTTGSIQIPAQGTYSANVSATNYFGFTLTNVAATTTQNASLYQAVVTFNATEVVSGSTITNFTVTAPNGLNSNGTPVLFLRAGTYNLTFNKTGWYTVNQTFTITALQNNTQTFTDEYRYLLNLSARNSVTGSSENNFTINITSGLYSYLQTITTTTGNVTLPWTNDTNINITLFNAATLARTTTLYNTSNWTATPVQINITIGSLQINTIQFVILSEQNNTIINGTINLFLTGTTSSYNYTTTNGYVNTTIIVPDNYIITYGGTGWQQRQVLYTLTNQTNNVVSLYLLSTSQSYTLETFFQNQNFQPVAGTNVTLSKKNLSGTNYYTVYGCVTDANGRCVMNVDLVSTTYRIVYSVGSFTGSSGDLQFTINDVSTGRTFYINTVNSSLNPVFQWNTLGQTANIRFITVNGTYNGTVRYTLNNPSLIASQACLYVYRVVGVTQSLANSSCTTASSAVSLDVGAASAGADSIYAQAYVTVGGVQYLVAQNAIQTNTNNLDQAGRRLTLFVVVIAVLLTLVLQYTWNPIAPPFMVGFVLYVFASIGLLYIPVGAIVSVIVFGFAMVLVIGKKT